jgi:hypothetical protein
MLAGRMKQRQLRTHCDSASYLEKIRYLWSSANACPTRQRMVYTIAPLPFESLSVAEVIGLTIPFGPALIVVLPTPVLLVVSVAISIS